jgi:hypothetical protein
MSAGQQVLRLFPFLFGLHPEFFAGNFGQLSGESVGEIKANAGQDFAFIALVCQHVPHFIGDPAFQPLAFHHLFKKPNYHFSSHDPSFLRNRDELRKLELVCSPCQKLRHNKRLGCSAYRLANCGHFGILPSRIRLTVSLASGVFSGLSPKSFSDFPFTSIFSTL